MKTLVLLIVGTLVLSIKSFAADLASDCAKEWPGNYQMQEHCQKQMVQGAKDIYAYLARYGMTTDTVFSHRQRGEVPALIYERCMKEWDKDFRMAAFCLKREEEAGRRLGKIGGHKRDGIEFVPGVEGDIAALAVSLDYLEKHNLKTVDGAKAAAARNNSAALIFFQCQSEDHRAEATCLLNRGDTEPKKH